MKWESYRHFLNKQKQDTKNNKKGVNSKVPRNETAYVYGIDANNNKSRVAVYRENSKICIFTDESACTETYLSVKEAKELIKALQKAIVEN